MNVSKEYVASIIRTEKQAKQFLPASCWLKGRKSAEQETRVLAGS
jgi:hypothetical protein